MKVKRVTTRHYDGPVYDITVENAHSFFANGIRVHNCHCRARLDRSELLERARDGRLFSYFDGGEEAAIQLSLVEDFNPYHDKLGRFTTSQGVKGGKLVGRKPEVITEDEFKQAVANGATAFYRGISGAKADQYADELRAGKQYVADDINGAGTFVAVGPKAFDMATVVGRATGGRVIHGILKPGAKVITYDEAKAKAQAELQKIENDYKKGLDDALASRDMKRVQAVLDEYNSKDERRRFLSGHPAAWAREHGYDALRQHVGASLSDEMVIFNLGALRVVAKDYKPSPTTGQYEEVTT